MNNWTRKELLALPHRPWDDASPEYDSVLVLSSRTKHDSGWACMTIIGCRDRAPVEICATSSDDIEWKLPPPRVCGDFTIGQVRSDCLLPAGAIHFWTHKGKFRVGHAYSSITVELTP